MKSAKKRLTSKKPAHKTGPKAGANPLNSRKRDKPDPRPSKKSFEIPPILLEGDDPPLPELEASIHLAAPRPQALEPDLSAASSPRAKHTVPLAEKPAPETAANLPALATTPPTPAPAPVPYLSAAQEPPPSLLTPAPVVVAATSAPVPSPADPTNPIPATAPGTASLASSPLEPAPLPASPAPSLPEAYGTGLLLLLARDTHWLYAHWDFTREQLALHNAASPSGHLLLRIHKSPSQAPDQEIALLSDSTHWFVPVDQAGTTYVADLGWYDAGKLWQPVAVSNPATTPPEKVSEQTHAHFATIPGDVPLAAALEPATPGESSTASSPPAPPNFIIQEEANPWFPAHEDPLASLVSLDRPRPRPLRLPSSEVLTGPGAPSLPLSPPSEIRAANPSSFASAPPPSARGFWLNLNAELVVYGATEPDASLEIGGHRVHLAADGSFNLRFALPDGDYELPVTAVSADGQDTREASLRFSRHSIYRGSVGVHPQSQSLKKPAPENIG